MRREGSHAVTLHALILVALGARVRLKDTQVMFLLWVTPSTRLTLSRASVLERVGGATPAMQARAKMFIARRGGSRMAGATLIGWAAVAL